METFDLYRFDGSPSALFFQREVRDGSLVWIESGGFGHGPWADRRIQERLRFAALDGEVPGAGDSIEDLRFIEADIVELNDRQAKIRVAFASRLGIWARQATRWSAGWSEVPEAVRPPADLLARLRDDLRGREWVYWRATEPEAPLTALYLFKGDSDNRCVAFTPPGRPSYLVHW